MEKSSKKVNKKVVLALVIFCVVVLIFTFILLLKLKNKNEIPDNYLAIFNGEAGEITYSTYIYKIDNGQANYGFTYINTTNHTKSWGSSEILSTVTKRGKIGFTDEVFKIAKENNAYSYVKIKNDDKIYSIDEFMSMFLMN